MDAPKWPLDPSKKENVVMETQPETASSDSSKDTMAGASSRREAQKPQSPVRNQGPPEGAVEHDGVAISEDAVFFAPPPAEIGRVVSASSNLRKGQHPMSINARVAIALVGFLLGILVGVGINWVFDVMLGFWRTLWPTVFGALGALIAWLATGFNHVCTYVGEEGIAKFTCKGRPENINGRESFLFKDARELRTIITRHYTNGVYSNTTYNFTWSSRPSGRVHSIRGSYRKKEGDPPTGDLFHYAEASEMSWTVHLLEKYQRDLDEKGAIQFDISKGDNVRIGRGYMEFTFKGKTARCDVEDIETISIGQGFFTIKRKDAKVGWFRKDGVFQFSYGTMANARLFVIALDKILGFRFGGGQSA